jgi:hypothetical protein
MCPLSPLHGARRRRTRTRRAVVTLIVATLSLTGCDEFSSHARAAQEVLDGTTLPSDFSPAGTSYLGMTQDTPVQKFTAPPGTGLVPSAVHVPDAFEPDLTIENQLREGRSREQKGAVSHGNRPTDNRVMVMDPATPMKTYATTTSACRRALCLPR